MKAIAFCFFLISIVLHAYEVTSVELSESATEYPKEKRVELGAIKESFPSYVETIHALLHFKNVGKNDKIKIRWIAKDALPEPNINLGEMKAELDPYTKVLHIFYEVGKSKLPAGHYAIEVYEGDKPLATKNFTVYSPFEQANISKNGIKIYLARDLEKSANEEVTPVGVSEYFDNSQHTIHLVIPFEGIRAGLPFTLEWYVVQSENVQNMLLYKVGGKITYLNNAKTGTITGNIHLPRDWPTGIYEAVFRVDGKVYAKKRFAIGDVKPMLKNVQTQKNSHHNQSIATVSKKPITKAETPPTTKDIKSYAGFRYKEIGCYKDQGSPSTYKDRDLNAFGYNSNKQTVESCIRECGRRNFRYAGLQYGLACVCDNDYGKFGKADNCNMPCTGDSSEICGGSWANSVYEILNPQRSSDIFSENLQFGTDRPGSDYKSFDLPYPDYKLCQKACKEDRKCKAWAYVKPFTVQGPMPRCWLKNTIPPAVKNSAVISGYKKRDIVASKEEGYIGCYRDQGDRDLNGYFFSSDLLTPEVCSKACARMGFKYAGVQYGSQCFCGNEYGKYGPADNCDMKCSGDASKVCGGTWANSIYNAKE